MNVRNIDRQPDQLQQTWYEYIYLYRIHCHHIYESICIYALNMKTAKLGLIGWLINLLNLSLLDLLSRHQTNS